MRLRIAILFLLLPSSGWAARIGYFGDSQSAEKGYLFSNLYNFLNTSGNRVETARSVCGATIESYNKGGVFSACSYRNQHHLAIDGGKGGFVLGGGRTVSIDEKLNEIDVAIIQLGDNHLSNPAGAAQLARSMAEKMLKAGKGCVWIGPQSIAPANAEKTCISNRIKKQQVSRSIDAALEKTVVDGRKCSFVDSFSLTDKNPSPGDAAMCLHYAPAGYKSWANAIRSRLESAVAEQSAAAARATPGASGDIKSLEAKDGAAATREGGG